MNDEKEESNSESGLICVMTIHGPHVERLSAALALHVARIPRSDQCYVRYLCGGYRAHPHHTTYTRAMLNMPSLPVPCLESIKNDHFSQSLFVAPDNDMAIFFAFLPSI
jgi:hypothetical protein